MRTVWDSVITFASFLVLASPASAQSVGSPPGQAQPAPAPGQAENARSSDSQQSDNADLAASAVPSHTACAVFEPLSGTVPYPPNAPLMSVHIMANGDLQNAKIFKSSGDNYWDRAALDCANGYRFVPVQVAGKPAEIDWVLRYLTSPTGSGFAIATIDLKPCDAHTLEPDALKVPIGAKTIISYHVHADGAVAGAVVTRSSGLKSLDDAATTCVGAWRFHPATQNGVAVTIDREITIPWRPQ